MTQVGCGSVGLMRTPSWARTDGPAERHTAAATAKSVLFKNTSLFFVFLPGIHAKVFRLCLRQRYRPVKPPRAEFRSFLRPNTTGWRLIGPSARPLLRLMRVAFAAR